MEWHDLQKMKADDLKELAKEKANLEGVAGMHKAELVETIAAALGIEKPHKVVESSGKEKTKKKIREMKAIRDSALRSKDRAAFENSRKEIRKLKRKLRREAHVVG